MEPCAAFSSTTCREGAKAIFSKARPDWTLADWGLRWLWNRPEVDIVLSA